MGARERCASATIFTIWASIVSLPTRSARMTKLPDWLRVAPLTGSPWVFSTGTGSPVSIDFVDRAPAFLHDAVDRDLVARPDPQPVADLHVLERHLLVRAIVAHAARGLRGEPEQRLDRARGLLAGPDLEHLTEQDQGRDHRGGLEIDVDLAVRPAEAGREDAGCQGRDHAVEVGGARADPDQGPHVRAEVPERGPAALEDRPAGPEHDRGRQRQLQPVSDLAGHQRPEPEQMIAHDPEQQRQSQRRADPKPPAHVEVLGARPLLDRDRLGLERHAADRAVARSDLLDLRVHRAGVNGVLGRRPGLRPRARQIGVRRRLELARATFRAEPPGPAAVLAPVLGGRRVHGHAADRVFRCSGAFCLVGRVTSGGRRQGSAPPSLDCDEMGIPVTGRSSTKQKKSRRSQPAATRSGMRSLMPPRQPAAQPARSALIFGQLASALPM